jgi:hypothetical protein
MRLEPVEESTAPSTRKYAPRHTSHPSSTLMELMSLGGPWGAVPSLEWQATATNRIAGANIFIG